MSEYTCVRWPMCGCCWGKARTWLCTTLPLLLWFTTVDEDTWTSSSSITVQCTYSTLVHKATSILTYVPNAWWIDGVNAAVKIRNNFSDILKRHSWVARLPKSWDWRGSYWNSSKSSMNFRIPLLSNCKTYLTHHRQQLYLPQPKTTYSEELLYRRHFLQIRILS